MKPFLVAAAVILSISSLDAIAADGSRPAEAFARFGATEAAVGALTAIGLRLGEELGYPYAEDASLPASQGHVSKTRAEVKQAVLDAIADGTLPGPGENLGHSYTESLRAVTRLRMKESAGFWMPDRSLKP